ncbi:MAG: FAD-dependent oxidoreductase [Gammaproteobacteria bacterium]
MTEASTEIPAVQTPPSSEIFPKLTPAQIERVANHGRRRPIQRGEVLVEVGQQKIPFFVVLAGEIQVVRLSAGNETFITAHSRGQFTGEVTMLSGRPAIVQIRVSQDGEAIELDRAHMLALVQNDSEFSQIMMQAFILRHLALVARGFSDVVLVGSAHNAGTLRVKEFLTRNGHPYTYLDLEHDADVQNLLDQFHFSIDDIPVLICRGKTVLRHPTNQQIAVCLGFNETIDQTQVRDLIVVGAGPSGLAAAVYGASEGLDVLVIEADSPGGQAGLSSRIENYLGFPMGVSGQELTARAYTQAQKFGAQILIAKDAVHLYCDSRPYAVGMEDGTRIPTRAIIIASGAQYRKPAIHNLPKFEGAGVYYAATFMEGQLCTGEEVIVIGGGNSAGQAAVFLADTSKHVHMLVRSGGLAESMSRYLIQRIEEHPHITLHYDTELAALEGNDHLQRVSWRNNQTDETETRDIRYIFVMAGADPSSAWLEGCLLRDTEGFIKTGMNISAEELKAVHWPLARPPFILETSLPGVFAVGDVRQSSIKRVASAVGEGSTAIAFVHQVLHG